MVQAIFDVYDRRLVRLLFRNWKWFSFSSCIATLLVFMLCPQLAPAMGDEPTSDEEKPVELVVLGVAQDGGYPQAGCLKPCCQRAWEHPELRRWVSCAAIVDHQTGQRFLLDCTPDFPAQLQWLEKNVVPETRSAMKLDGILLTHAHIGHYSGLMHLGREVMGSKDIPVYAMPRMQEFLKKNGPWSQLVELSNIKLQPLAADQTIQLNARLSVVPILVPHRDEFSETVGFIVSGPHKRALFLPDIDKWSRWDRSIEEIIAGVDIAYVDGTFLADGELPGRDMDQIPHPFIQESINQFAPLDESERKKVRFIHLNHTNPALQKDSSAQRQIRQAGMAVAEQGEKVSL
jgi:pyrroloquinoline quinone biosynthesis protein B